MLADTMPGSLRQRGNGEKVQPCARYCTAPLWPHCTHAQRAHDARNSGKPNKIAHSLFLRGTLRESFGRITLSVTALATRDELTRTWIRALRLTLSAAQAAPTMLERIAVIVKQYPGETAVELQLPGREADAPARMVAARTRVAITEDLLRQLADLLGDAAVCCIC